MILIESFRHRLLAGRFTLKFHNLYRKSLKVAHFHVVFFSIEIINANQIAHFYLFSVDGLDLVENQPRIITKKRRNQKLSLQPRYTHGLDFLIRDATVKTSGYRRIIDSLPQLTALEESY